MAAHPTDRHLNLSELLVAAIERHSTECISLPKLALALRDRSWGGILLVFASINLLPLPPGTTTLTGVPLILITAQMALGRATPWFPKRLSQRSFTKTELRTLLAKLLPWERRIERILRPRLPRLTGHGAMRAMGCTSLLLSIILWLPIPLGNHLPALSMTLFAVALIYRDGVVAILGGAASLLSLLVVFALGAGLLSGMAYAIDAYLPAVATFEH